jgi:hypothetical protein
MLRYLPMALLIACSPDGAAQHDGAPATTDSERTVAEPGDQTRPAAGAEAPSDRGLLALGESAVLGAITVTPLEVTEESRCPTGASCVWVGRVVVRVRIDRDGRSEERLIDTIEPLSMPGIRLRLVEVGPPRNSSNPPRPATYRFRFSLD